MKIAAISDLHGHLPNVPECDLLIVAGDICPDKFPRRDRVFPDGEGQRQWIAEVFVPWLDRQPAKASVVTFGNHDFQQETQHISRVYVDEQVRTVAGNVWLSPWSNTFGGWAFMKAPSDLAPIYAQIPDDTDIIVSHQPPYGYGDTVDPRYIIGNADPHCGSKELLAAIDRVKPRLVICGHIHGGFGRYEHHGTTIYNVSVVDEAYRLVNAPTLITQSVEVNSVGHAIGKPSGLRR